MREELLAHLIGIYGEEIERHDEPAALAATFARFGSPAELTAELDRSVGGGERWAAEVERFRAPNGTDVEQVPGESLVGYVARSVLGVAALNRSSWSPRYAELPGPPADRTIRQRICCSRKCCR